MVDTKDCYIKNTCKKRLAGNCPQDFCRGLYQIDLQYDLAQLSQAQRKPVVLYDPGKEDYDKYMELVGIQNNIVPFVKEGHNLYLNSAACGTGKTSWGLKLLQAYVCKSWIYLNDKCGTLFINVPRFFIELKQNFDEDRPYIQHIMEHIEDADLVVWDEVGMKGLTPFESEQLFNYINMRIDAKKANIYTSNQSPQELQLTVGTRLYSRIVNESKVITFTGADKRREE